MSFNIVGEVDALTHGDAMRAVDVKRGGGACIEEKMCHVGAIGVIVEKAA